MFSGEIQCFKFYFHIFFFQNCKQEKTKEVLSYNYQQYKNEDLKRQFKKLVKLGYAALSSEKFNEITEAVTTMESNYAKVRICSYKEKTKCNLQLEPGW